MREEYASIPIISFKSMQNLMSWLQENGRIEELEKMKAYYDEYGAKDAA